jgi:predicted phosphohydrolase
MAHHIHHFVSKNEGDVGTHSDFLPQGKESENANSDALTFEMATECDLPELKVVCVSDTHNMHDCLDVPSGDVLIHAGDWSNRGTEEETRNFNDWLGRQPHPVKLVVSGNHEFGPFSEFNASQLSNATHYLCNDYVDVAGVRFYGISWKQQFISLKRIRGLDRGVDVLVLHEPPFGILDGGFGCETVLELCNEIKPRFCVFGHVHHEHGTLVQNSTKYINCAVSEGSMRPQRIAFEPEIIQIKAKHAHGAKVHGETDGKIEGAAAE